MYLNEFNLYSELKFQNEDISPRKNTLRNFKFNVDKTFENSFTNRLSGLYSEQRKDFYFDSDSLTMDRFEIEKNIQSRIENRVSVIDRLNIATTLPGLSFFVEGGAAWRTIDRDTRYVDLSNITSSTFDTKINEFRIDLNTAMPYVQSSYDVLFSIMIHEVSKFFIMNTRLKTC